MRKAAALSPEYGGKIAAMDLTRFHCVFLTHLHADHTMGYPDLIFTSWIAGRDKPLKVYGPKGTADMTEHILEAYKEDIRIRTSGSEPINDKGWMVRAHEIEEGLIYSDTNVRVEAFLVEHGSWPEAYGFKFITPDQTIAISGDTRPCENLVDHCKNIDILIHEVYSLEKFKERPQSWQAYHKQFHTSTLELAGIASRVKPGLLILYHQLYWGATDKDLIREINQHYKGPVVSAQDLDIY
jgi:ribonuclease Z